MRWVFILVLVTSCTSGIPTSKVSYDMLLNDGNSKVWMIDKEVVNSMNIAPYLKVEKQLIIFYQDGTFSYGPMKSLGRDTYESGIYWLDSEENRLSFEFSQETEDFEWNFEIAEIYEDSLYLIPAENASNEFSWKLVPFPKF